MTKYMNMRSWYGFVIVWNASFGIFDLLTGNLWFALLMFFFVIGFSFLFYAENKLMTLQKRQNQRDETKLAMRPPF